MPAFSITRSSARDDSPPGPWPDNTDPEGKRFKPSKWSKQSRIDGEWIVIVENLITLFQIARDEDAPLIIWPPGKNRAEGARRPTIEIYDEPREDQEGEADEQIIDDD